MTPEEKCEVKKQVAEELKRESERVRPEIVAKIKGEVLEELDRDDLKKKILSEVRPRKSSIGSFLEHPASMLVAGFILTTIFGTIITSCWKYREWQNEQAYTATQTHCERERLTMTEGIKQKNEVKEEIIKRVAETNTAAEEILKYFEIAPTRQEQEKEERSKYWKEASRNWRINSKILKQRLILRFNNPSISTLFAEITRYRSWVGVHIDNQQDLLADSKNICVPVVLTANECMSHVTINLMPQLVKFMNEEIAKDEEALRAAQCLTTPAPPTQAANKRQPKKEKDEKASANPCQELLKIRCERSWINWLYYFNLIERFQ